MRGMEAPSFGASKNWSRGRHLDESSKDSNSLAVLLREAAKGSAVAIIKNSETRQNLELGLGLLLWWWHQEPNSMNMSLPGSPWETLRVLQWRHLDILTRKIWKEAMESLCTCVTWMSTKVGIPIPRSSSKTQKDKAMKATISQLSWACRRCDFRTCFYELWDKARQDKTHQLFHSGTELKLCTYTRISVPML